MKKFTTFILLIILLLTVAVTFVGCDNKEISELKQQFNKINNDLNDIKSQYKDLEQRVKKLETTMSLLDTVGESEQFTELKNQLLLCKKIW